MCDDINIILVSNTHYKVRFYETLYCHLVTKVMLFVKVFTEAHFTGKMDRTSIAA